MSMRLMRIRTVDLMHFGIRRFANSCHWIMYSSVQWMLLMLEWLIPRGEILLSLHWLMERSFSIAFYSFDKIRHWNHPYPTSKSSLHRTSHVWHIDTRKEPTIQTWKKLSFDYFIPNAIGIIVSNPCPIFETDGNLMLLVPIPFETFFELFFANLNGVVFLFDEELIFTSK